MQLQGSIPSLNVHLQPISDAASMIRPGNLRGLSADSTLIFTNGVFSFSTGGPSSSCDEGEFCLSYSFEILEESSTVEVQTINGMSIIELTLRNIHFLVALIILKNLFAR